MNKMLKWIRGQDITMHETPKVTRLLTFTAEELASLVHFHKSDNFKGKRLYIKVCYDESIRQPNIKIGAYQDPDGKELHLTTVSELQGLYDMIGRCLRRGHDIY